MKVIDILRSAEKPFASFELVPPLKGSDASRLYQSLDPLMEFQPPFIKIAALGPSFMSVTYGAAGSTSKLTVEVASSIKSLYGVPVMPHLTCVASTKEHVANMLRQIRENNIDNIMALRGDALPGQKHFLPEPDGFSHSSELVEMISNLNRGQYLDPTVTNGLCTDFCIGVAAYPEKHFEAANIETDIEHLKQKVDAGANYIVTQMFFDNERFFTFVELCRKAGITVPIIPGLKPISSKKQIDLLPRAFHIDIPQELVTLMEKTKTAEDAYNLGIEWAIKQSRELLEHGFPAIHYYTMAKPDNVCQIVRAVF